MTRFYKLRRKIVIGLREELILIFGIALVMAILFTLGIGFIFWYPWPS